MAPADAHRPRVGRALARQHRRGATLRISRHRRHRQHGSAPAGASGLRTRPLGQFLLRGKRLPVAVHELAAAGASDEDLAAFASALDAFRRAEWGDAEERFRALVARLPEDGPSRFYLGLAERYRREPPAEWRGAVPAVLR
jgi:hypothetical protein